MSFIRKCATFQLHRNAYLLTSHRVRFAKVTIAQLLHCTNSRPGWQV